MTLSQQSTPGVGYLIVVLLYVALPALAIFYVNYTRRPPRKRIVQRPRSVCPSCNYSLSGLPERHVCPECGASYEPLRIEELGRARPIRGRLLVANIACLWLLAASSLAFFALPYLVRTTLTTLVLPDRGHWTLVAAEDGLRGMQAGLMAGSAALAVLIVRRGVREMREAARVGLRSLGIMLLLSPVLLLLAVKSTAWPSTVAELLLVVTSLGVVLLSGAGAWISLRWSGRKW